MLPWTHQSNDSTLIFESRQFSKYFEIPAWDLLCFFRNRGLKAYSITGSSVGEHLFAQKIKAKSTRPVCERSFLQIL
jgi:hypothetical protein